MKKIRLINFRRTDKKKVPYFIKPFFKSEGYKEYDFFLNFLDKLKLLDFCIKIIKIIHFLKKIKFKFTNPKKKKLIIISKESKYLLSKDLLLKDKYDYFILETRVNELDEIYISFFIIKFIIFNFFKRSLKKNYILALVKLLDAKIILTNLEISHELYFLSEYLKNKVKVIVIQTNDLTGTEGLTLGTKLSKQINIQELWCFGEYDKKTFLDAKCNVKNFRFVGSLKCNLSRNFFINNKLSLNKTKYDICLLSETHIDLDEDFGDLENLSYAMGVVAEYSFRLSEENNLNIIFSGRHKKNSFEGRLENEFYNFFLKKFNYSIDQSGCDNHRLSKNISQSKLVIGNVSTALRETFYFNKKVLACNFLDYSRIRFPAGGLSVLSNFKYEEFKERVMKLIELSDDEYFKTLNFSKDFYMNNKPNTSQLIYDELQNI